MRTTDVARAIFIISCVAAASAPTRWIWYLVNTSEASGLMFHFENPPEKTATITVTGKRGDKPFKVTATIDTDVVHGDTFFKFDTGNLKEFTVERIRTQMGDLVQTVENPETGTYYVF